jgi:hypothetical protein
MTAPCLDLEIGLALLTMRDLRTIGLPDPDSWTFTPYSRVEIGGDGRQRGFGYRTASWVWSILSQDQLNPILELFTTDLDASVLVYIYTYTDSGSGLGSMRARYLAIMSRPTDGAGKSMYAESRTPVYNDITLSFSHMTVA